MSRPGLHGEHATWPAQLWRCYGFLPSVVGLPAGHKRWRWSIDTQMSWTWVNADEGERAW